METAGVGASQLAQDADKSGTEALMETLGVVASQLAISHEALEEHANNAYIGNVSQDMIA